MACSSDTITARDGAMECEARIRLVEEYHKAALVYSKAAMALNRKIGSASTAESVKLRAEADDARQIRGSAYCD
jgi:hypothetical protein